ncbi:hypothetical protein [Cellulomonas hominis]
MDAPAGQDPYRGTRFLASRSGEVTRRCGHVEVSRPSLLRAGTLTGAALLGIGGTLGAQQLEADRHHAAHGPLPYYTGPAPGRPGGSGRGRRTACGSP